MSGVFITGTDTGVGKTFVTILVAKHLQAKGMDVGAMKPLSTGPADEDDALFLKRSLQLKDPLSLINPIHLKKPLAPYAANPRLKTKTVRKKIMSAYKKLRDKHEVLLVEGIGGIMVPITKDYFVADMINDLKLPVLIVARAGLGTINHTLLTIEALRQRKITIYGIVMNGYKGKELSEKDNAEIIEVMSGIPVLLKLGVED